MGELMSTKFSLLALLVLTCLIVSPKSTAPQASAPEGFEIWTPTALADAAKALGPKAAADPHHVAVKQFTAYGNDYFLLSHREAEGVVEWHETEADVFVVQSGNATLVVGGTQVGGETVSPHEKRGGTIEGGVRQKLAPGDIVRIPPRAPHQLLLESGQQFNYFVIKIKGY
jgi:mannose-6-phosphate isomerase-like protein (cupin superfamily)